ncbi:MAG: peptidoglycan-associated lipoprotein [Rickettsiales bacterium]|nr:MAG: peptidoglycan-associated lipoprotein [Rickettsiales bacterium]
MLKNIVIALFAAVLLSGCSSSTGRYGSETQKHITEFEKVVGDRVHFALNSSSLSPMAKKTLMRQAAWLKNHTAFKIRVEGHCDERGTTEINIALGESRADTVKRFLVSKGVSANSIDTISYGKERPAVIGNNESAWKMNRRSVTSIR